jgi:hypothetical protein
MPMNTILLIILLFIILILIWALLGGREDILGKSYDESKREGKTLRRRAADKEIEKEYPESSQYTQGRKTDHADESSDEEDGPFKLPYMAEEIIPEASRSVIYRRTLLNSEVYARKGDYPTAISLYEGVRSRIQDIDTRFKLDADIEYLKHFKRKKEEEDRKKEEDAKRGIAGGVSADKGEIKITFGGPVPNAINLDSLPSNINIGIVDPNKGLDIDAIAESVTQKLGDEIQTVKDELNRIKKESPAADSARENLLAEELAGLKRRVEHLDAAAAAGERYHGDEPVTMHRENGDLTGIRDEIREMGRAVKEMIAGRIPEAESRPALPEARFDSSSFHPAGEGPSDRLQDRIPKRQAPPPSELKGPTRGDTTGPASGSDTATVPGGRPVQVPAPGQEDDDFELLSEFGKEKDDDTLSDDEIFEKILSEDKPKEKGGFEILGEKRESGGEYITANDELELKEREDESFYRRLLRTNRWKKKELPILKVSYDFTKLPDEISLSREKNIVEYAFYKYKPMLEKADGFIKKRKVRDAINYYKVVLSQNIPPEFKSMVRRNLNDLTEYLEKYLSGD